MKIEITKELLETMYKEMSQRKIAEELGVSEKTIRRRFKEFNIETGIHGGKIPKAKKSKVKVKLKEKPPYKDKLKFEEAYKELKSLALVARRFGISLDTAFRWKQRHNIPTIKTMSNEGKYLINKDKPYTNKTWLEEQYATQSITDIAKRYGYDYSTIQLWMKRHGIKARNPKEQRQIKASYGTNYLPNNKFDKKTYLTIFKNEGRITKQMKQYIKDVVGKCQACGETEVLDLHHIDENHFNNKPENHIVLCPNCHAKIHRLGYTVNELCEIYESWIDMV